MRSFEGDLATLHFIKLFLVLFYSPINQRLSGNPQVALIIGFKLIYSLSTFLIKIDKAIYYNFKKWYQMHHWSNISHLCSHLNNNCQSRISPKASKRNGHATPKQTGEDEWWTASWASVTSIAHWIIDLSVEYGRTSLVRDLGGNWLCRASPLIMTSVNGGHL